MNVLLGGSYLWAGMMLALGLNRFAEVDLGTAIIAGAKANMVGVRTLEHDDRTVTVELTLETEGGAQFAQLLAHLDGVRGVISVRRSGSSA